MQIPSRKDWGDYESDLDARYAFEIFFGRSVEEATPLFHENPIERADELRFMPPGPFRYYILAFRDYVLSEMSQNNPDAASCYLRLIEEKITKRAETIGPVMPVLLSSVQKVAETQPFYDADLDIYGDFMQISARIRSAFKKYIENH